MGSYPSLSNLRPLEKITMVNSVFSILLFRLAFWWQYQAVSFTAIYGILVETTVSVVVFEESA